jgi:hypothetical protein
MPRSEMAYENIESGVIRSSADYTLVRPIVAANVDGDLISVVSPMPDAGRISD